MSSILQRIIRRRIGSVLLGLLGVFFLINAAGSHVDNWRDPHIEYTQNVPIFVIISALFLAISGTLLFGAWRLWRVPKEMR